MTFLLLLLLAATAAAQQNNATVLQNTTVAASNETTTASSVDAFPPGLTCVSFVKAGDNVNVPKTFVPCNGVGTDERAKQCAYFAFSCTSTSEDCLPEWAGLTVTTALCVSESVCDEIKSSATRNFYKKGSLCCKENACNDPDKQPNTAAAFALSASALTVAALFLMN